MVGMGWLRWRRRRSVRLPQPSLDTHPECPSQRPHDDAATDPSTEDGPPTTDSPPDGTAAVTQHEPSLNRQQALTEGTANTTGDQVAPASNGEELRRAVNRRVMAVIGIWETEQGHTLSKRRLHEFRKRPEIADLIEFEASELRTCARLVMASHDGVLRLSDWLALADERRLVFDARNRRAATPDPYATRRCPACDRYERSCICS